jgi:uncharacterized protein (TIGR02284 family)
MNLLKDPEQMALQEVTRQLLRGIRILEDLCELATDADLRERLQRRAARRSEAFERLCEVLHRHGISPVDESPERAHVAALWIRLKAAVGAGADDQAVNEALREHDRDLGKAIDDALAQEIPAEIRTVLEQFSTLPHGLPD